MRVKLLPLSVIVLVVLVLSLGEARAQGPENGAFIYQGTLRVEGQPASGVYDLRFTLYDAAEGGAVVGAPVVVENLAVDDGLFTVELEFGTGVFNGEARWLALAVRPGESEEAYTPLAPRQRLAPAPYAFWSENAGLLDGLEATAFAPFEHGHRASAITSGTLAHQRFSAYADLAAEGYLNDDAAGDLLTQAQADGRYWTLNGNAGTAAITHFLGTTDQRPLIFRVDDTIALRIVPTEGTPNLIGGSSNNSVSPGVVGATIGGGGTVDYGGSAVPNRVFGSYSTVGGGIGNDAGAVDDVTGAGAFSTIGGGVNNEASGFYSTVGGGNGNHAGYRGTVGGGGGNQAPTDGATVAGGVGNEASGRMATIGGGWLNQVTANQATVGGGYDNSASGGEGTVSGGHTNAASGLYATVPGGIRNTAAGRTSLAAGRRAKANHDGAFVWADDQNADMASTGNNQFIARAGGGFFFQGDSSLDDQGGFINTSTGAHLSAGGAWINSSDAALKENFAAVDGRAVLRQVAALPISTWNYKAEAASVRHVGPTAQDFAAAFSLGNGDTNIATVDADGVALAAIQGLNTLVAGKEAETAALKNEVAALQERVAALEAGEVPAKAWRQRLEGVLIGVAIAVLLGGQWVGLRGRLRRPALPNHDPLDAPRD